MLRPDQTLALFMEGASNEDTGKMGFGVLRYSPNPIACVIDSATEFTDIIQTGRSSRPCPIVDSVEKALAMGAEVLVIGIAPGGGLIPLEFWPAIEQAVQAGMCVVNGLHDLVGPRFPALKPGQWIWDVRLEPPGLGVGSAAAAKLDCRRVLFIGTDMAVGKMTAGLEIHKLALERGIRSGFVATGQIGITVTGAGVPLDAVRVDFASGAIEREVVRTAEAGAELVLIEGQGALIHPGSTANLPLMRGSCPTHLVLCHRAGQTALRRLPDVAIPSLTEYVKLYEALGSACGTFPLPRTVAVALNTSHLDEHAAQEACEETESMTGLPCADPVRHGSARLLDAILA